MSRLAPVLAALLLVALPVAAGVESHNQYRVQGPVRYVVSIFEIVQDHDTIKTVKRTYKWKQRDLDPANERGVLPGESYGPIVVDKSVNHIGWAGAYWRQDGAFESTHYVVEVTEGKMVGEIRGETYPVEVTFKLVKRKPLMQPNLAGQ